jgi:hypothetical protein
MRSVWLLKVDNANGERLTVRGMMMVIRHSSGSTEYGVMDAEVISPPHRTK